MVVLTVDAEDDRALTTKIVREERFVAAFDRPAGRSALVLASLPVTVD